MDSTPVSPVQTSAPATSATSMPVTSATPVRETPVQPRHGHPVRIDGSVVTSNPDGQTLTITTGRGDIKVQSTEDLPPNTKVTVELYLDKTTIRANIFVQRQQISMAESLQNAVSITPSTEQRPPLKQGDTVTAVFVNNIVAPSPETLLPLTTAADILKMASTLNISTLNNFVPAPLQAVFESLVKNQNPLQALQNLPHDIQKSVISFLSSGDIMASLKRLLPPEKWASLNIPEGFVQALFAGDITPAPDSLRAYTPNKNTETQTFLQPSEATESSALDVLLRAQIGARITQKSLQSEPSSPEMPRRDIISPFLRQVFDLPPPVETDSRSLVPMLLKSLTTLTQSAMTEPYGGLLKNIHELKILQIMPPTDAHPASALPNFGALSGIVEDVTPNGFPMIRTDSGQYILRSPEHIAIGTHVVFEAKPMTHEQIVAALTDKKVFTPDSVFNPKTDMDWPTLKEALHAITTMAPDATQNLRTTIPTPSAQLPPTALLFLAALRLGNIENWLGPDTLQSLRLGKQRGLADRLAADFSKISETAKETLPGGWRLYSMPLLHDEHLTQMHLYVRHQQDNTGKDNDTDDKKPLTRFVLNVHLSRMGDLQMDGFIRKKNFDMILRTAERLPIDVRQEILRRFATGLEHVNMQGTLSFQTRQQGWVTVNTVADSSVIA